jgi:hypothetical protein
MLRRSVRIELASQTFNLPPRVHLAFFSSQNGTPRGAGIVRVRRPAFLSFLQETGICPKKDNVTVLAVISLGHNPRKRSRPATLKPNGPLLPVRG